MKKIYLTTLFLVGVLACDNQKQTNKKNKTQNNDSLHQTQNQTNMKGFKSNIENDVLANEDFRKTILERF